MLQETLNFDITYALFFLFQATLPEALKYSTSSRKKPRMFYFVVFLLFCSFGMNRCDLGLIVRPL